MIMRAVLVSAVALLAVGSVRAQVGGFSDVPKDHWAAQAVARLSAAGIVRGDGKGEPLGPSPKPVPQTGGKSGAAKPASKTAYDGNKPVTRYELAVTLYRFVQYMEATDKQKRGKTGVEAAPRDGAEAAKRLVSGGYLPANTPLARDGSKVVTANQLADALAQVITRNREKHTPITPDSERTQPIEKPQAVPGT